MPGNSCGRSAEEPQRSAGSGPRSCEAQPRSTLRPRALARYDFGKPLRRSVYTVSECCFCAKSHRGLSAGRALSWLDARARLFRQERTHPLRSVSSAVDVVSPLEGVFGTCQHLAKGQRRKFGETNCILSKASKEDISESLTTPNTQTHNSSSQWVLMVTSEVAYVTPGLIADQFTDHKAQSADSIVNLRDRSSRNPRPSGHRPRRPDRSGQSRPPAPCRRSWSRSPRGRSMAAPNPPPQPDPECTHPQGIPWLPFAILPQILCVPSAQKYVTGSQEHQSFSCRQLQTRGERLSAIRSLERHLEVGGHTRASWHRFDDGGHIARGQSTTRQCLATHVDALLRSHKGRLARGPEVAKHSHAAHCGHEHWQGTTLGSHCDEASILFPSVAAKRAFTSAVSLQTWHCRSTADSIYYYYY